LSTLQPALQQQTGLRSLSVAENTPVISLPPVSALTMPSTFAASSSIQTSTNVNALTSRPLAAMTQNPPSRQIPQIRTANLQQQSQASQPLLPSLPSFSQGSLLQQYSQHWQQQGERMRIDERQRSQLAVCNALTSHIIHLC